MTTRALTVGTAGHIDHGKTALVKALTGKETDRLPEERRRGISIELGYAQLELDKYVLSLIDVPGHERFVKTMIAGATGIDAFLLVVDAREGVMPQTEEHLLVLRSLGVVDGLCAVTKCDLAEPDQVRDTIEQLDELMPGYSVIETSATTGDGVEETRAALGALAEKVARHLPNSDEDRPPTLHVDRVFSLKGHGTIVTGTLWSGQLREGQKIVIEPGSRKARIRSLQIHDRRVTVAEPHQRVAVNIVGIGRDQISKGDLLTSEDSEAGATYRVDVALTPKDLATELGDQRVQVHHGTRDATARIIQLEERGLVQLRLEDQLLICIGDRLVLRSISDHRTLGGGQVKDKSPARRGLNSRSNQSAAIRDSPRLDRRPPASLADQEGDATTEPRHPAASEVLSSIADSGLRPLSAEEISKQLNLDVGGVVLILSQLSAAGQIVRLEDGRYTESENLAEAVDQIIQHGRQTGSINLAEVRDLLGIGRRTTHLVLRHCDSQRITLRHGDSRHLRREHQ